MSDEPRRPVRLARPFAITGGRTRSGVQLNIEDLVVTTVDAVGDMTRLHDEQHLIASLCLRPRSVAEVAAVIDLPLGVTRVVVGDLVSDGMARVYGAEIGDPGNESLVMAPVLERLIHGLRTL